MFDRWTLKQKLLCTFTAILALGGALIGVGLVSTINLIEKVKWNDHTYRVMQQSESMLLSMVNIETGLRGFVASGDEKFLEPLKKGQQDFGEHHSKAKSLTSDNPSQQTRLEGLMAKHQQFMEVANGLLTQRREVNAGKSTREDLLKEFRAGKDKAAMDAFRSEIAEFTKAESTLLDERSAAMASTASATTYILALGGIGLCLATAILGLVLGRSVLRQLGGEPGSAVEVADRVTGGDLSVSIPVRPNDTSSVMANLARMQDSLATLVSKVRRNSESVATASAQIAQGNQDLSGRTEKQASALQQTAATMDELGSTVRQNADSAKQASQLAQGASVVASQGKEVVGKVVTTMQGINESSRRIGDIISVIDGIAFQTNLLALNAAVEAARAGEQGRGFAVVASEVRNLAQRSADAAKEIKTLIGQSVQQVEQGTLLVDEAGKTMGEIVSSIRRVTDIVAEISSANVEQSTGVQQVGEAVSQMDQATQQNAALVEESAAAAESLRAQAQQLVEAVSVFKLAYNGSADSVQHSPPPAKSASTERAAPRSKHAGEWPTPRREQQPASTTNTAQIQQAETTVKVGRDEWASF
jgi:methyl-accepting chemotaxis protein